MEKFTESEYKDLADGLTLLLYRGQIEVEDYHAQLIALAANRASADNKPEVLIQNVQYQKTGVSEIAHGFALNHPRLGAQQVRTSLVISKAEDGSSFETLNTRYLIVPDAARTEELKDSVLSLETIPLSKSL